MSKYLLQARYTTKRRREQLKRNPGGRRRRPRRQAVERAVESLGGRVEKTYFPSGHNELYVFLDLPDYDFSTALDIWKTVAGRERPKTAVLIKVELEEHPTAAAAQSNKPNITADEISRTVEAWLLTKLACSAGQIGDPNDLNLIRLEGSNGVQFPPFQFEASGEAIPLVLEINQLLHVNEDPWGVADWWLGDNSWLDAVPADILGGNRDEELRAAAQAEIERL